MANTTFVNQSTVIDATWLNDVNDVVYDVLGNGTSVPATEAEIRTNLNVPQRDGTDATGTWPIAIGGNAATASALTGTLAVANGGTGATTAASARTNLGLTIGTDVLAPSGSGASLTGMLYLGVGQTSQDLTASRALGTTYTNSTGKPIFVSVRGVSPAGSTSGVILVIGGVSQPYSSISSSNPTITCGIVPNGTTYSCTANGCTLGQWVELR